MFALPFFAGRATFLDKAVLLSIAAMAALNVAVCADLVRDSSVASAQVRSA